jgi:hypothetical protein
LDVSVQARERLENRLSFSGTEADSVVCDEEQPTRVLPRRGHSSQRRNITLSIFQGVREQVLKQLCYFSRVSVEYLEIFEVDDAAALLDFNAQFRNPFFKTWEVDTRAGV